MAITAKHQRGVSLIEAMVSLLVISVGLLGIAALQVTSMKQNNSALHHSKAVWTTYNISDRIRANFSQFGKYAGIDTNSSYNQDCSTNACTAPQMVTWDASEWSTLVQDLPGGRGIIASPSASELIISVMWDDEGTGATGTNCGADPAIDLTCYSVTLIQ